LDTDALRYNLYATLTLDVLYPIAYSLMFSLAISAFLHTLHCPRLQALRFVPFAAALVDYAENTFIVLFSSGRLSAETAARPLVALTAAKWLFFGSSAVITVVLGIATLV
ncbi:MAG TPA: hypothetical protein VJT67_11370, partial [Longimicrobiaceae bacterium]|nr:hypothetical protein [Longimicrobiaceae bacterium]